MTKTHLSFPTGALSQSVAFYRTLLGTGPTKRYADYALFELANPGLELALSLGGGRHEDDGVHFGLAVDTHEEVTAAIERLRGAGYPADLERDAVCCYAREDKVWATDPDGRRWEVYKVIEELDEPEGCCAAQTQVCCSDS